MWSPQYVMICLLAVNLPTLNVGLAVLVSRLKCLAKTWINPHGPWTFLPCTVSCQDTEGMRQANRGAHYEVSKPRWNAKRNKTTDDKHWLAGWQPISWSNCRTNFWSCMGEWGITTVLDMPTPRKPSTVPLQQILISINHYFKMDEFKVVVSLWT